MNEFFIDSFRNQVKRFRLTIAQLTVAMVLGFEWPLFSFTVHCENFVFTKLNILASKLLSPCYESFCAYFKLCV